MRSDNEPAGSPVADRTGATASSRPGPPPQDSAARVRAEPARDQAGAAPGRAGVVWGWIGPLLVTVFGAFLRFGRLSVPHAIVFDETYYVPDAYGIMRHGVEINHVKSVSALLAHGNAHILVGTAGEYVAHPPLGKIMIAAGEWLFGLTPFGWRFAVAVTGSLAILMTARIARRMTRSTLLGCAAGLLLALDGLEFVLSRTAILDIFVMFWVLAAFGLLVIDRDRTRARLAAAAAATARAPGDAAASDRAMAPGDAAAPADAAAPGRAAASGDAAAAGPAAGPRLGIRWRRVLAGICLGLACACKWNGVWYILAFAVLVVGWDLSARRAAGLRRRLRSDAKWLPVWFGIVPAAAYVASWSGWFASPYGYDRTGTALNGGHPAPALLAWYQYNRSMLSFGLGLTSGQSYKSNPLGWLLLTRPISLYSACLPAKDCGSPRSTEQEVLAIGTPLIWWASVLALLACAVWWLARRDWRTGAVLISVAAGWLPWIWFSWHDHRTEFFFYAVVFDPFLVIAITLCLELIASPAHGSPVRHATGAVITGAVLAGAAANFAYLYPILAARVIPFSDWFSRMWLHGWI
jgi:dolichyl-phosphate-mannose-protein mannosyltransferase